VATIIDSLTVMLGLDSSKFKKGMGEANNELKDAEKQTQKTQAAVSNLAKEFGSFLAITLGATGIGELVIKLTQTNAQLALMSSNLATSTQTLQAWSNASEQLGGDAKSTQGTFSLLSKSITEMQVTGQTAILPYLRALGVTLADASGAARPLDDVLLDLADRFSSMDRPTASNLGAAMGIDSGTLNLLLEGRKAVEMMIEKQKALALVNKQLADQSLRIRSEWTLMTQKGIGLANDALSKIYSWFEKLGKFFDEHSDAIIAFITSLSVALMIALLPSIIAVTRAAWGMAAAFLANPLTWVVVGITALSAAIALLYEDYKKWSEGGKSLFDWSWLGKSVTFVKDEFDALVKSMEKLWGWFTKLSGVQWLRQKFGIGMARITGDTEAGARIEGISAPAPGGASLPRGLRNFNPGNLNFAGQTGASKEGGPGGRFAVFHSMAEGMAALNRQLDLYAGRGVNTIEKIVKTYAPASENNVGAYISALAKVTGRGATDTLGPADRSNLIRGIVEHENGRGAWDTVQMAMGGSARTASSSRTVNSDVSIGQITVVTQATDAKGITRDIGGALRNYGLTFQADTGLD
jgi:hypothetical protein